MDGDHWFPTRGNITETNGAIARCIVNDLDDNEDIASTLCIQSDFFDDGGARRLWRRQHDHKARAPRQTNDDDSFRDVSLANGDALTLDSIARDLDPGAPLGGQLDLLPVRCR